MLLLDSLSALSKRALFPSYSIIAPEPSSRASKSRMTSVYIRGDGRTPPRERRVIREGEKGETVRTRVCESAITDGANVRTMDRFDWACERLCSARVRDEGCAYVYTCVCICPTEEDIFRIYIWAGALLSTLRNRSFADSARPLCAPAKLSPY